MQPEAMQGREENRELAALLVANSLVDCFLQVAVASKPQTGDVSHWFASRCTFAVLLDPTSRVSPRLRNNS